MAMESGEAYQETPTLGSGDTLRLKATECIPGRMATGMRENGNIVSNMVKAQIYSKMVIPTQVNTRRVNLMAKGNTLGRTAPSM